MFGLFTRTRRPRPNAAPRAFRPCLEALEMRNVPSTLDFMAVPQYRTLVDLAGFVNGVDNPAGITIEFSGAVVGTATTDENGAYDVVLQATSLGQVTATADVDGMPSASDTISSLRPFISSFSCSEGRGYLYTFYGTVDDEDVEGETVTFGGLPSLVGKTATVQADGTFSLTVQLSGTVQDNGNAEVSVTDWWGQQSYYEYSIVHQTGVG